MYKIIRNRIIEELEIEDNGNTLHLDVDINVDAISRDYMKAEADIIKAEDEKSHEALGTAILALFTLVFGEKQTAEIVEFYEERYIEMLSDIFPFINEVVTPKITEARKRIENRYKQVKK